ncbi:MAG: hypothetical protein IAE78_30370, partial [Myxococcus sp.]|nr:hypothetical protein [Myxococcus sp.]
AGGSVVGGGSAGGSVVGGGSAGGSVVGGGSAGGSVVGGGSAGGSVVGGGSAGGSVVGGGSAGGSPSCNTGQVVTGTGAVAAGSVTAAAGTARASCAPSFSTTGTEHYFLWTAPATGTFTFDTNGSTFDTILSASSPTTCAELACDDDSGNGVASSFSLSVTAGQVVRLMLDTFSQTTSGSFTLNIASNDCPMGTHACGMTCAPNTSVASCGMSCVPCTAPTNGSATCDGTSCGIACNAGFQRCGSSCVSSSTATWQARPDPLPFTHLSPPAWGVDSAGALWHAWMQTSTSVFGDPQLDVYVGSPTRAPVMVHRYTGFYASVSTDSTRIDALALAGGDLCFFFSSSGDLRRTCRAGGFTTSSADPAIGLEYGLATDSAGLVYKVTASTTSLTLTGASAGTIDVFPSSVFVPVNDVAVALDAMGGVHVLYSLTTSSGLFVKYARRSGATWTVSTLEEINLNSVVPMTVGRGSVAVAVTPAGVVHLAWTRRWRRAVSGAPDQNAEDVRHATSMGGAPPTAITSVITGFAVGSQTGWNTNQVRLAVDATGNAQLVFAYQPSGTIINNDSRQTWYGVWNGTSFTTSRIGGVQALQLGQFGFDASQRPTSQQGGTTLTLSVCAP